MSGFLYSECRECGSVCSFRPDVCGECDCREFNELLAKNLEFSRMTWVVVPEGCMVVEDCL